MRSQGRKTPVCFRPVPWWCEQVRGLGVSGCFPEDITSCASCVQHIDIRLLSTLFFSSIDSSKEYCELGEAALDSKRSRKGYMRRTWGAPVERLPEVHLLHGAGEESGERVPVFPPGHVGQGVGAVQLHDPTLDSYLFRFGGDRWKMAPKHYSTRKKGKLFLYFYRDLYYDCEVGFEKKSQGQAETIKAIFPK